MDGTSAETAVTPSVTFAAAALGDSLQRVLVDLPARDRHPTDSLTGES
ncbi:hypothetical protein HMPREF1979_02594 [Actinomyces johnsonii F0542]|uniref:Uncharacterized protein n=1 Tax=Actinomyces johnsonii F0542 TaxID=1321818 RepID=U1QKW3_9ACTO|nr:hypothetical protein HMPREF1979_02594 [Actinomyces johnsonii F0542]